ncbi:MAG: hypothetical protein HOW73_41165 [Polyangiaceae bacterium]|nr:hypothetical protein [Polyangiaceae bacterium]
MSQSNLPNDGGGTLVRAPALPTDQADKPFSFDPQIGEGAFSKRAPSLRAMDPGAVTTPNCDASRAALTALQFVKAAQNVPSRSQAFAGLGAYLGDNTLEMLREQAWTLWYLDSRVRSIQATKSDAKVDLRLAEEGTKARARVLRMLTYHLGENPRMEAELKDIALGTGWVDLASDLARLAGHISVHKEKLAAADPMNFRPDDEVRLRGIANEIVAQLNEDRGNETADLRNRAWTQLVATYAHLKSAADFIFHKSPSEAALFPGLRQAVMASNARRSTEEETAADPTAPVSADPAAPAPVEQPATAPVAGIPGLPGGSPLIG